ncbi:hypothetical protein EGJ09_01860 [Pseudomonas sp. p106]|nr:hypothetical protein EGJ09_01860 [Pseudomonas sp. p106]
MTAGSHWVSAELESSGVPVGAGLPAITGKAGALRRSACIAGKPTQVTDQPRANCSSLSPSSRYRTHSSCGSAPSDL